jgi:hypothetical protein
MAWDAERGMGQDEDDPRGRREHGRHRLQHAIQRIHVLDAQQEDGRIEPSGREGFRRVEVGCVADDELAVTAVVAMRERDHPRARVDAAVACAGSSDVRREHALPRPDVEEALALSEREEVEGERDRLSAVVAAAVGTDPAVVPVGEMVPA